MHAVLPLLLASALAAPGAEAPAPEVAADADAAYLDALLADAAVLRLWERREWRVLGHYKGRDLDRWRSQADGADFFLARRGKDDPEAELRATLRGFFAPWAPAPPLAEGEEPPPHVAQHPQCRFPARYRWLDEALGFDPQRLPRRPCPQLDEWRERLDAVSATLVFADAYIDNPASMFGHTFLRLERSDGAGLLANTVNFAAFPWTTNPFIYPVAGIVGWFPGQYSTLPYYVKVREYTALENRDLWEYPLLLGEDGLQRLVEHLWEVGPIPFRYHYFDENCSYQLLALLEGMDPALRLTDRYTAWVFPTSTLRTVVAHTDLVGEPRYRASRYQEMAVRRDRLTAEERPLARALARAADPADLEQARALPAERAAAVLDAAYELHRYRTKDAPQGEDLARDQRLLVARGAVPVASEPVEVDAPVRPDRGHRPGMAALGAGLDGAVPFLRLRLRPALHDLLAPQGSYVAGTRLEMVHLAVRLDEGEQGRPVPRLEQLILFDAASVAPSERWITRMAWRLRTGWEPQRHALAEGACAARGCLYYGLSGGPGLAAQLGPALVYGFVEGEAALGGGVGRHLRLGPGAAAGVVWALGSPVRLHVEGRGRYPAWSDAGLLPGAEAAEWTVDAGLAAHLSRDLELRGVGQWVPGLATGAAELWVYW